jgi:hypothetical protein
MIRWSELEGEAAFRAIRDRPSSVEHQVNTVKQQRRAHGYEEQ